MENPRSTEGGRAPVAAETSVPNDSKVVKRRERSRGRFRRKRHSKTQSVPDLDSKLNQEGTDPFLDSKLAGNDDKYHSMPRKSRSRSGSKSRFSGLFKRKSRSTSGVRSRSETDVRNDERKSASDLPTEVPKLQGIMKNKNDNSSRSAGDINKVTAYSDDFVSYVRYSPTKQPRSRLKRMTVKDAIEERRSMFSTIASIKQQVDQNNTLSSSLPDVSNIDSIDDNAIIQPVGDDVDSAPVSNQKSFTLPRSKKQKIHKSLNIPENQFEDRTLLIHCDINGNGGYSPSDGPSTPSRVEIISNVDSQDPKKDNNGESDDNSEIFFECTDTLTENKPGKSKPEPTIVPEHSDQTAKDPSSAYKSPDGKIQKHRDESRSRFLELSRKMSVVPTTNNTHIDNVIANTYLGRKESIANSRDISPMARSSERFRSNLAINQVKRDISDSKDSINTLSNKPSSRASTLPRMQVEPLEVIMGKASKQSSKEELQPLNLQDLISSAQSLNFSLIYQPMLNYNNPKGNLEGMPLEEREEIHPAEVLQEAQIPKLAKEEDPLSDTETDQPFKSKKQKSKKGIFFKRKNNDKILKAEKKKDKESKKITEEAKLAEKEAKKAEKAAKQAEKEAKLAEKEVAKAKAEANLALKDAKEADKEAKQAEEEATHAKLEAYEADYEAKLNEKETKKAKQSRQAEKEAKKAEKGAKKAAKEAKQAAKESQKATKEAKQAEKDAKEAKKEAKLAEKEARKAAKEAERKEKNKLKREKSSKTKKNKAKSRQEDPVVEKTPEKVENEPDLPKDDSKALKGEQMDTQNNCSAPKTIPQDLEPFVKIEQDLLPDATGQIEEDAPTLIPIDPKDIISTTEDLNAAVTLKPPGVSILKVPDTNPDSKENDPYLQIPKRTERSLSDGEVKRQRESPRLFKRSSSANSGLPPPVAESKIEYKNVPQMGTSVQQRYRRTFSSKSNERLKLPEGVALLDPNSSSIESSSSIENNMTKSSSPDEGIDMKTHDDEDISMDSGVLSRETSKKTKNNLNRPRIHSQRSFRSKKEKEREGSSEPVSRLAEISTQTSEEDLKLAYKLYIKARKRQKKERELAKRRESFAVAVEKQKEEERLQRQAAEVPETLEVKTSLPLPEIRVADEEDANEPGVAVQDTTLLSDVPEEAPDPDDQPGAEEPMEDEPTETTGKEKRKKKKKEKKRDKKKEKKKWSIFSRGFSKKEVKTEDSEPELDDLDKSIDPSIPLIDDETFIFIENEINLSKLAEIKETDILDDDIVEPDEKIDLPKKHLRFDTINLQPIQGEEPLPPISKFGRLSRRRDSTIREKRKKCLNAFKKFVAFLFSHIGLCSLVVAYTIMGGFVFKAIEGPYESSVKSGIREERSKLVGKLMQHAFELTMSKMGRMNFTNAVDVELQKFQIKIHTETKDNGWDGNDDRDTPDAQWSFASALLYAITVMTTIGKY
ncbi:hypothetical protein LOTGIDRAFT_159275 [Lottia gigantea]|uniref:Potassium channel domain-containing protein n=1 Tax=Lottia gigantea TaxID=225164 RepID=V4AJG4_LOTGI|nr:hypothetical protein LOTGIDRAFT_159275 [Lottia gigantea]ESO97252.1 hypothetical protein LOTGIDRAFT_159275 [Lottia gigantea]